MIAETYFWSSNMYETASPRGNHIVTRTGSIFASLAIAYQMNTLKKYELNNKTVMSV